ncbi:glycerophosphodiester phosphodiesterase family protein [uncultured Cyclobacterium sp.]|uniref:glycerophosphodiester phosphodiesterase family protein n=1 Tax=uncultured Cyclobacterium sp. TaxID=453820 RepID=UPI0030ED91A3
MPPPKNGHTYVIAHRGAHEGIPENSLPAYQKAIDLGCDFVEIDLRTTLDKQFVSVHNSSIDAYVDGKSGIIKDMNLAELKALAIGKKIAEEWQNTRIPTFEEILKLCQGKIGIYLDLKDADPSALLPLIRQYKMEENIVWFMHGNDEENISKVRQNCANCFPMPDPGKESNLKDVLTKYQPKVIASGMRNCSLSFSKTVHEQEAIVFVDESKNSLEDLKLEWTKMIEWGIDGIQTDKPEALIGFLKNLN